MEKNLKELPPGQWMFIRQLPENTTAETFSDFLMEHGMNISADYISVREHPRSGKCSAVLSVTKEVFADLINWALQDVPFNGAAVWTESSLPQQHGRKTDVESRCGTV